MDAFVLACVRAQVDAVIAEIRRIEGSEFPYNHTQEALKETLAVFETHRDSLASVSKTDERGKIKADSGTVELACSAAFLDLSESIDLLGFLLRSTNVRNAFEAYGPLLRLTRQLLGDDTKLIISSEWYFSPFTYLGYHYLPGFALIGLPAPESSNPFLLPLAGHELGHTAWPHYKLGRQMEKRVEEAVIAEIKDRWPKCQNFFHEFKQEDIGGDLLARPMWKPAWDWALRQCEEHFCDFFGLRIFGEAYLRAFAYLLAPQRKGLRSLIYPNLKTRAQCLVDAAGKYEIACDDSYVDLFQDLDGPAPENVRESLLLSLADAVRRKFVDHLQNEADRIISESKLVMRSPDQVKACRKKFEFMVPAERSEGLVNILNAAWEGWLQPKFFVDKEHNQRRLENLHEVVLKSIEILEIEARLGVA